MEEAEDEVGDDIKTSNTVLKHAFLGDWNTVIQILKARQTDATSQEKHVQRAIVGHVVQRKSHAHHLQDANNLSVALLNQGKLSEAIAVLETAFRNTPSIAVAAEPLVFNLGMRRLPVNYNISNH